MTATQIEFTAANGGFPVACQEPSLLAAGASAPDRKLIPGRIRGVLAMLGPALVASVAYVDPGNFATNIQGSARYVYQLLWVVLAANLMAMVVQYLSAKLGIVTGRALPELVRDRLPLPATWSMWVQGEVVAMATDGAEFIGAALG
jgi:manganese transport protein